MRRWTLAPVLVAGFAMASAQQTIELRPGQIISQSAKVVANERLVLPPGPAGTCLTIKGDDITVDFNDAYVRGDKDVYRNRENFNGVGLLIDGCRNVTVKNAHIQGFRFNIKITNSQNVKLINCDVSFSRAIRMTRDGAPLDTFLNLRDPNAWRSYGAGVWIEKSSGCVVEKCYGTGAQNGVILMDSDGNTVHNSDFSFNGGWGVALSHSNDNVVSWNRLDFVNRVWAGGWGGDSSGIAVANDSDRNFFVGNSMTHGGDGFFLSNRNDIGTVNPATGFLEPQGGSDENVIANNDGSWSPNNAFEGTFSDGNAYVANIAKFSGYGYWLGFSTNSLILNNVIGDNVRAGIAIEHGKGNRIEGNRLERNGGAAIHLWQGEQKERTPFPSTGIDLVNNTISDSSAAFALTGSTDVAIKDNTILRASVPTFEFAQRPVKSALSEFKSSPRYERLQQILASKPTDFKFYWEERTPKGVGWLQPAEYAPLDYRGRLAAQRQVSPGTLELYLLEAGVRVSGPDWTTFEDTHDDPFMVRITANPPKGKVGGDRPIQLSLSSKDGKRKQKVTGILRTTLWTVRWYLWSGITFEDAESWARVFARQPVKTETTQNLGGDWSGRIPTEGLRADHYALVATTQIQVPPGRYLFRSIADDGIRVFVDGRLIISRWKRLGRTADNVAMTLDEGVHEIRVEYCQEDGAAELKLNWTRQ